MWTFGRATAVVLLQVTAGFVHHDAHIGSEVAGRKAKRGFCEHGKAFPALYLLGCAKCGTSTVAAELRLAGVHSSAEPDKEMHFFDKLAFSHRLPPNGSLSKEQALQWLHKLPDCKGPLSEQHIVADFTPDNLWQVPLPNRSQPLDFPAGLNLPLALRRLYRDMATGLTFLVMLREPLSRYQSAFYFERGAFGLTTGRGVFAAELVEALALAEERGVYKNRLWASMYASQLGGFLRFFEARQFYLVPYLEYMSRGRNRIFADLSARLDTNLKAPESVALHVRAPESLRRELGRFRPALQDDVPWGIREHFVSFMAPENSRLVSMLANLSVAGGGLANYQGPSGSEKSIKAWLEGGWALPDNATGVTL